MCRNWHMIYCGQLTSGCGKMYSAEMFDEKKHVICADYLIEVAKQSYGLINFNIFFEIIFGNLFLEFIFLNFSLKINIQYTILEISHVKVTTNLSSPVSPTNFHPHVTFGPRYAELCSNT